MKNREPRFVALVGLCPAALRRAAPGAIGIIDAPARRLLNFAPRGHASEGGPLARTAATLRGTMLRDVDARDVQGGTEPLAITWAQGKV